MAIKIGKECYIAKSATLIGDVTIGDRVAIMEGAVLRGDLNRIFVGNDSNIQDNVTVHTEIDHAALIGNFVSVGHNAVVHGSVVHDYVIVGMGALTLNGATVNSGSVIAAGSVVQQNFTVPELSLVAGVPGVVKRTGDQKLKEYAMRNAESYSRLRQAYLSGSYDILRGSDL
ncbi:MAG: gamma carbonic anhydrase family protein [Candidatus Thermoplasmatota archaeon]|nr:gamma carbonic anhydrase family protein [Candidatus Thermoplasmatota archaeon]